MHVSPVETISDFATDRNHHMTQIECNFEEDNNNNNKRHKKENSSPPQSPLVWTSLDQHPNSVSRFSPPHHELNEKRNECVGCQKVILDRYFLFVGDERFHVSCLKCVICHVSLDSQVSCFSRGGRIYCKQDYYKYFVVQRCTRCGQGFGTNDLVMKIRNANLYHLECFTCAWCNIPLSQGDYFGVNGNLVYCKAHFIMTQNSSEHDTHNHPCNSQECQAPTSFRSDSHSTPNQSSESIFHSDIMSPNHYQSSLCHQPNHHNQHNFLPSCQRQNTPHPVFPESSSSECIAAPSLTRITTETGAHLGQFETVTSPSTSNVLSSSSSGPSLVSPVGTKPRASKASKGSRKEGGTRRGRPRKQKPLPPPSSPSCTNNNTFDASLTNSSMEQQQHHQHASNFRLESESGGSLPGQTPSNVSCQGTFIHSDDSASSSSFNGTGVKTKRMRTSFKHHQLRAMKQYFAINQNPDAKDLKALAQQTNLSKRVLQVWFQNARAKWRRNVLRMHGHNANTPGGPLHVEDPMVFKMEVLPVTVETSSSTLFSDMNLKGIHGLETPPSSTSCSLMTGHEISCSPGSSSRPYSSP